jgi:hypothetical protein
MMLRIDAERQVQAGMLRQRARADRLAVFDIALNQKLEQDAGAIIKHGGR